MTGAPTAGGRRRLGRTVVVAVLVALVVAVVAALVVEGDDDEPASPGGRSEAPAGDGDSGSDDGDGWVEVALDGVTAREGAAVVVLDGPTVAVAGGQVPGDPGRLVVEVVDLGTGRVEPLAPLAVANPSVAGATVAGGRATLLLASGEVVTFAADGTDAPALAAGAGPAEGGQPQPAATPPGGPLVDVAAPAAWAPDAGAWQPLPAVPATPTGYDRAAAVTGDGTVVVAGFEAPTLVLGAGADAWRELPAPPLPAGAGIIGLPTTAAAGERVVLVDDMGNGALVSPGDGRAAALALPADRLQTEGCELHAASGPEVAVVDRCGDVLVVDGAGDVHRYAKPVVSPQHAVATDGDRIVLLAQDTGGPSLWHRPL